MDVIKIVTLFITYTQVKCRGGKFGHTDTV